MSLLLLHFSFVWLSNHRFVTLPVGIAGPLVIDGVPYLIPLATTEGALVASTHRGCSALTKSGKFFHSSHKCS